MYEPPYDSPIMNHFASRAWASAAFLAGRTEQESAAGMKGDWLATVLVVRIA